MMVNIVSFTPADWKSEGSARDFVLSGKSYVDTKLLRRQIQTLQSHIEMDVTCEFVSCKFLKLNVEKTVCANML